MGGDGKKPSKLMMTFAAFYEEILHESGRVGVVAPTRAEVRGRLRGKFTFLDDDLEEKENEFGRVSP